MTVPRGFSPGVVILGTNYFFEGENNKIIFLIFHFFPMGNNFSKVRGGDPPETQKFRRASQRGTSMVRGGTSRGTHPKHFFPTNHFSMGIWWASFGHWLKVVAASGNLHGGIRKAWYGVGRNYRLVEWLGKIWFDEVHFFIYFLELFNNVMN